MIESSVLNLFNKSTTASLIISLSQPLISFSSFSLNCDVVMINAYVFNLEKGGSSLWKSADIELLDRRIALTSLDINSIVLNTSTITPPMAIEFQYSINLTTISQTYLIDKLADATDITSIYKLTSGNIIAYAKTPEFPMEAESTQIVYNKECIKISNRTVATVSNARELESIQSSIDLIAFAYSNSIECESIINKIRDLLSGPTDIYDYYNLITVELVISSECTSDMGYLVDDTLTALQVEIEENVDYMVPMFGVDFLNKLTKVIDYAHQANDPLEIMDILSYKCKIYNELPLTVSNDIYDYYYYKYIGGNEFRHNLVGIDYYWKSEDPFSSISSTQYPANSSRDVAINITLPTSKISYDYSKSPEGNADIGKTIGVLVSSNGSIKARTSVKQGGKQLKVEYSILFPFRNDTNRQIVCQLNNNSVNTPLEIIANTSYYALPTLSTGYTMPEIYSTHCESPTLYVLCNYENYGVFPLHTL